MSQNATFMFTWTCQQKDSFLSYSFIIETTNTFIHVVDPIGGKGTYLYGSTPLREYWSGPGSTSFQSTLLVIGVELVRDPAGKK